MKRVGVYLRVSTQHQSTGLQREELGIYVKARGWTEVRYYEDQATGTNGNRPGLKALMLDVRARKLDVVISWKMCRLFRSLKDLVSTLEEFQDLGVDYIGYKDNVDMTTASGRLLTHLIGAFAEFEAALIRERVMAGLASAKLKGVRLGRPPQINIETAIAERRSGQSLAQIAAKLNVSKSAVSKTLAKQALKNPMYLLETCGHETAALVEE